MNAAAVLIAALLVGPIPPSSATLQIRIHVGGGRESDLIRSELAQGQEWFLSKRLRIESTHRIVVVDDLYKQRPCYQIGSGDARHEFPLGTFCCSGSFTRTLQSIAECDMYDRQQVFFKPNVGWFDAKAELDADDRREWRRNRPEVFPPVDEPKEVPPVPPVAEDPTSLPPPPPDVP